MRNNNTFRLSAQNSLKVTQVPVNQLKQKSLLNTFKGGNDLRNQLGKTKLQNTKTFEKNNTHEQTLQRQLKKSRDQVLAQEVAALDNFKVPVTRQKTKNMIENIKLRRREKHIDTMNRFKEDLDDYKENLINVYASLINDIEQVMTIKETAIQDFFQSCHNDQYLLSRQKDFVDQIKEQVNNYRIECQLKLNNANDQLQRLKQNRGDVVSETCSALREALIQIAFVLQGEARQIQQKEKTQIQQLQEQYYKQYRQRLDNLVEKQKQRNEKIENSSQEIIKKWRNIKQEYQLSQYLREVQQNFFRRPQSLRSLYDSLMELQNQNHDKKIKLIQSLVDQDTDAITKNNLQKWNQQLKKINDSFDQQLDDLLNHLVQQRDMNKKNNEQRMEKVRDRLKYIENHNEEQIQQIMNQKIVPLCQRNIKQQADMLKDATAYVQQSDQKQNGVLKNLSEFVKKIGEENDNFLKQFSTLNQKYEIEKAKILDDDEQLVDRLKQELNKLKQQLKQALHHIKLDEVEQKCFEKVDEIQKAYRTCHENNKSLKQTRQPSLEEFMKKYQDKIAQLLLLYSTQRRGELEKKNQEDAQQEAARRFEKQQKKKAEQEAKAIQQAKAKGGKPPAPAKKDPKKAAAQQQQRKKAILAQIGTKAIEQFKMENGTIWLVYKSIKEICQSFYSVQTKQNQQKKQQNQQNPTQQKKQQEEQKIKAIDAPPKQTIIDCRGDASVSQKAYIRVPQLIPAIETFRRKLFDKIVQKRQRILRQSEQNDQQMLDQSLSVLDDRLKAHYSLKGQIQSQIYVRRSGQITGHKKKYQKFARMIKDKMDLQTQKFNFLLEKGLETLKAHNSQQKMMKQHIPKCKNLSQLQGMYSRTRQNYNSFGLTIKEMYGQLERLCTTEVQTLLQKNQDFIKQSKLMGEGGDYSNDQIKWYQDMLSEITNQMKQQIQKRKEKYEQLKLHSEKKRKDLLQAFEKQYHLAVQQLSARDGTGKKYGRPKRIAQQKTRLQMNKCEQAQIGIDRLISELAKQYEVNMNKKFYYTQKPPTLEWRQKLMALYTCITRYGKHIEAFKSDLKVGQMKRVNYDEKIPQCKLTPEEEEEDKKRKEKQLKYLDKLAEQKDDRVFMKYIDEIEKIISEESRTIYTGQKAKFLTGNDKIPDFLRAYIGNMKKNAQQFRIACIRQLRQSCQKLSDLSNCMSQLFFSSIQCYEKHQAQGNKQTFDKTILQFVKKHRQLRSQHMKKLRPNLVNPKCQDQLKQLDQKQKNRDEQYKKDIENTETQYKDKHFSIGQSFLSYVLNNYEFLLLYIDSMYLQQDFVKCPGDEIEDKIHLDVQKLMVMKQKGIKIDPTSQRNLRRKWQGLDFNLFNIGQRKYMYKKVAQQVPKQKDKKAGKKDSKDPKKAQQEVVQSDPNKTKVIQTFKTWRQKSAYDWQTKAITNFKILYDNILFDAQQKLQLDTKQNSTHAIKWRQTADSLYLQ